MDNGFMELLRAERSKLMTQVEQINALLGDVPVLVAATNGDDGTIPVKRGRGVTAAILTMLHENRSLDVQEIAFRLKAAGLYGSHRKAAGSAGALLSQMKGVGTLTRSGGRWSLAR